MYNYEVRASGYKTMIIRANSLNEAIKKYAEIYKLMFSAIRGVRLI